ncbi:MAG: FIG006762: Phosphoglycerate mutase family, partial [uncultured Phycisphaerae bacterium]
DRDDHPPVRRRLARQPRAGGHRRGPPRGRRSEPRHARPIHRPGDQQRRGVQGADCRDGGSAEARRHPREDPRRQRARREADARRVPREEPRPPRPLRPGQGPAPAVRRGHDRPQLPREQRAGRPP